MNKPIRSFAYASSRFVFELYNYCCWASIGIQNVQYFMSVLQDQIPEGITIRKCRIGMSLILILIVPQMEILDDLNRHKTQL